MQVTSGAMQRKNVQFELSINSRMSSIHQPCTYLILAKHLYEIAKQNNMIAVYKN